MVKLQSVTVKPEPVRDFLARNRFIRRDWDGRRKKGPRETSIHGGEDLLLASRGSMAKKWKKRELCPCDVAASDCKRGGSNYDA